MSSDAPSGPAAKTREQVMRILDHALEEEVMLSATLRHFLGGITGPNFHSLYRLFGDHCRQIDQWLGEIADRARAAGMVARAGAGELARSARAAALPATLPVREMIGEVLALHERIAHDLRDDLAHCPADAATADLLSRLLDFHETTAWMLRMVQGGTEVPGGTA